MEAIRGLLAAAQEGLAGLLFEGAAGIGKTTLFAEALAMAESAGFRVLASRGAVSEAALSLAAVVDLLEPVPAADWQRCRCRSVAPWTWR